MLDLALGRSALAAAGAGIGLEIHGVELDEAPLVKKVETST